ncbi:D-serine ammonia-lyase [Salicibibacter cibarius]|uniref:Probable D-serine dehydratase n=1 Tax=Salicibibacter cibarius TaxID=2743000 RepID=A0A7T6Z5B7_9BACI|nr:D-serine ammonia-lyase [Salicibibacter cibarius]QQK77191.1 D-serine ammonia-lyase [Salicibibacter cibarius]
MKNRVLGELMENWTKAFPLLEDITALRPVWWENPYKQKWTDASASGCSVSAADMKEAAGMWMRFRPFIEKMFPETRENDGNIESPLRPIPNVQTQLENHYKRNIEGTLYLKCDNELPIAGSIKARGGIFEVLKYAETLAIDNGMITQQESYEKFASPAFKRFFNQYAIDVGSTGNLGLSIGIVSAAIGFDVSVHMSADAKQWKKDLLKESGANVYEYSADFSKAINEGRKLSLENPNGYFVDDENSRDLFLGYSIAAFELKAQLDDLNIRVDSDHPLFLYLPCGVGGSPGGLTFGLKQLFGDNVHCFFVEPTHSPSVLIGLMTEKHEKVSVQDFGIDNVTEADGLAVGRPSSFATAISEKLVSGVYTVEDDELFKMLALLMHSEGLKVEPSAASGLQGPIQLSKHPSYIEKHGLSSKMKEATHVAWATGGSLIPNEDWARIYQKGNNLLGES